MPSALFVTTVDITLEAFLLPFADMLRDEGWRVDALSAGATGNRRIEGHFDHRYEASWGRNVSSLARLGAHARTVRELVRSNNYDVVHVHTPNAAFATRFALRGLERPRVIYTAHGFHFYKGQSRLLNLAFRSAERIAAPWTDILVTINEEDLRAARGFGLPPERALLIPGIGVDTSEYRPDRLDAERRAALRSEMGAGDTDFLVIMIAEFIPRKRHEFVLKALSTAKAPDLHVCFVGTGRSEARVRELAAQIPRPSQVTFSGYRRDVADLLGAADAVMLASRHEGMARGVLEGMASGLPVIGTRTRGIVDAYTTAEGWIAEKDDPASLARCLEHAAGDRSEARKKGAAARQRAVREYSLDSVLARYRSLYEEPGSDG